MSGPSALGEVRAAMSVAAAPSGSEGDEGTYSGDTSALEQHIAALASCVVEVVAQAAQGLRIAQAPATHAQQLEDSYGQTVKRVLTKCDIVCKLEATNSFAAASAEWAAAAARAAVAERTSGAGAEGVASARREEAPAAVPRAVASSERDVAEAPVECQGTAGDTGT